MLRSAGALAFLFLVPSCAMLVRPAATSLTENVSRAILEQNDPETVRDGAPAYLLAIDGLVEGDPENKALLLAGARLYSAYASAFVEEEARRVRLAERALAYARRALCAALSSLCEAVDRPFDEFAPLLEQTDRSDLDVLYGFGAAWAGWVEARADDWAAVAELPKVEAVMRRVLELDDRHDRGGAHLYLGVLLAQRPAQLGGRPEQARMHFEQAIAFSEGRNLMAKVIYAKQYARLVFDRELHDRLLGEVLAADPHAADWTLSNVLAKRQARGLLDDAPDYF